MEAILLNNVGMLSIAPSGSRPTPSTCLFSVSRGQSPLVVSKACHSIAGGMKLAEPNPSTIIRRSGNYKPTMWDFEYIQSINNDYAGEKYRERFDKLKKEMKKNLMMMVGEGSQEVEKLELIDNLERLGVSYHFKDEIMQILGSIHEKSSSTSAATSGDSLYYKALKFRILRQRGFHISQDLCKAYLREARWYHSGYKPTLQEYMDNAWISIATPLVLLHAFIFVTNPITNEALESLNNYPDIIRRCSVINRLLNDLGTSLNELERDIFNDFKDMNGNLKHSICNDTKGLLQLYESSFLCIETETTLKNATRFTVTHLKNYVDNHCGDQDNIMVSSVLHALDLPRHWMMPRLETEWYISIYERMSNTNPLLLELAKLDFNIVQETHQQELRILSRWWKSTCLAEKLSFSRDRLVENFFWAVGTMFELQHSDFRKLITKVIVFSGIIDDIYDVYGTLDELELFTDAIQRWDTKAMAQLPDYMKICYLALINTINEVAYEVLKKHGVDILPYLTKSWTDLCISYLREARWYYNGYKPSLEEYMDNAWISIAVPMVLVHSLFLVTNSITKEILDSLSNYPDIIRWSATIFRFVDDLGTSSDELKRGDVPKSIQCYMNEKDASEEEAREHVRFLIKETWEVMNTTHQKENSLFSETFVELAKNIARTAHCMYLNGDGHGIQNTDVKSSISKILFEPIAIPNIPLVPK